jgi:hypothetical protein
MYAAAWYRYVTSIVQPVLVPCFCMPGLMKTEYLSLGPYLFYQKQPRPFLRNLIECALLLPVA